MRLDHGMIRTRFHTVKIVSVPVLTELRVCPDLDPHMDARRTQISRSEKSAKNSPFAADF